MPGPNTIELAAVGRSEEGLRSILVGGNAVNLHAYLRSTFDVDLLIPEEEAQNWRSFFERHGYAVFHATSNFVRLRFAADPTGALPVDLMLADSETFERIYKKGRAYPVGHNLELVIPDPLHLVAMKLHALRNPHRIERGVDLEDVKHLVKAAKIDTTSPEFVALLDRYATAEIRARLLRDLEEGDSVSPS